MDFKYYTLFGLPKNERFGGFDKELIEGRSSGFSINDTIRIQSIELNNFKGVEHGHIELYPVKGAGLRNDQSSILAIYGQNGSGKTTVIEALYVLKGVMTGNILPENIDSFISNTANKASMKTVFEYRKADSEIVEYITYEFSLSKLDSPIVFENDHTEVIVKAAITDEVMTLCKRDSDGRVVEKTRKLFDANSNNKVLNTSEVCVDVHRPSRPEKVWNETFDYKDDLESCLQRGQSRLFYSRELNLLDITNFGEIDDEIIAVYPNRYGYLDLLDSFARHYLFIAGANFFNAFSEDKAPIYFHNGYVNAYKSENTKLSFPEYMYLTKCLAKLNSVLSEVVPGLKIIAEIEELFDEDSPVPDEYLSFLEFDENTKQLKGIDYRRLETYFAEPFREEYSPDLGVAFYTKRGDVEIPLTQESEGIKRIIYSLDLFISAYNNPGITVAIDEFDAGIFEFLLGELLEIFESSGRGQLIVTCHNLRPLEVLERKNICFSTANPVDRYTRLKYIGKTNNLRDVYFREIITGSQEEKLYQGSKKYKLVDALERYGDE